MTFWEFQLFFIQKAGWIILKFVIIFKLVLINPIVIGHNKKPRSFGNWNPNSIVDYIYNSNAWMTMDIFSDWLLKLNNIMKIFNRHILLLIDNAGGHNITDETKKN